MLLNVNAYGKTRNRCDDVIARMRNGYVRHVLTRKIRSAVFVMQVFRAVCVRCAFKAHKFFERV